MAVPSRRKCVSRIKRGRSSANFAFKRRILQILSKKCENCKSLRLSHHLCLTCYKKGFSNGGSSKVKNTKT